MSIDSSFFIKFKNGKSFSSKYLVQTLISKNWQVSDDDGKILYLPIGDKDFEWQYRNIPINEFLDLVDEKDRRNEVIGILFYWKKTNIGIHMLIYPESELSCSLSVNKKTFDSNNCKLTNINWYLERLIPALSDFCEIESFSYEEC